MSNVGAVVTVTYGRRSSNRLRRRFLFPATLFGFVVLGEFPDWLTFLGIAVIVASGVYIAIREGQVKKTGVLSQGGGL
jgi:drug/metabolite transporter (DMT)-like permease